MSSQSTMNIGEAVEQLQAAVKARKCWPCGCFHSTLEAVKKNWPNEDCPAALHETLEQADRVLKAERYDCLGCEVCFPAIATNALNLEADHCPAEDVDLRHGWPPLPGDYTALRFHAPVAICTLSSDELHGRIVKAGWPEVSIAGTMKTENLGVERLITNVAANPHIRHLILCGGDAEQKIGHLPGRSLLALVEGGLDEQSRIIGAPGRRPVLKNISAETVNYFRKYIEIFDLIGCLDVDRIQEAAKKAALQNVEPAPGCESTANIDAIMGYVPARMKSDPAGYFVIHPDRTNKRLILEHYSNDGVLDKVITGRQAAELYWPAIEHGLVSLLDHAAYLGRELERAEAVLNSGAPYEQDAAPELENEIRERTAPDGGCRCANCDD